MVGNSNLKIVREWLDPNAPTGEAGMYQTEDGRVWRTTLMRGSPETGVTYATRTNEDICPES